MILYHATYRTNIPDIKKYGLGAKQNKNWEFSIPNTVCLTNDPDVAFSFCETADEVSKSKLESGIIVLMVNTNSLDGRYGEPDPNMINEDDDIEYYIYRKIIDPRLLYVVTSKKGVVGRLLELKRIPSYE